MHQTVVRIFTLVYFPFNVPSRIVDSKMRLKISRYALWVNVLYRFHFQSRFGGMEFVNKFMLNNSCFSLLPCRLFPYLFYRYVTSTHLDSKVMNCFFRTYRCRKQIWLILRETYSSLNLWRLKSF